MNTILKAINRGKGSKVKMEGRYTDLSTNRSNYLEKAQEYARFTLPNVFSEDNESGSSDTQHGFDSIGAKAVNHLVNKIMQVLWPAHLPFFKLNFSDEAKAELAKENIDETALKELLVLASEKTVNLQSKKGSRVAFIEALKQLIIGGNTLIYVPKEKNVQAIPLDFYVIKRDTFGQVLELIIKQSKDLNSFPEEMQTLIKKAMKASGSKPNSDSDNSEAIDLYTWVYLQGPDEYAVAQVAYDILLKDKQVVPAKRLPWIPLTWNLAYNRNYGNGLVEDYSGDFYAAEFLHEALAKGLVLMADIKYMLKAGSITRPEDIFGTPTGEVITGNLDDVGVLQLEKFANFEYIATVLDSYKKSISEGFLMGFTNRRQGERVTAYEISLDAREMEGSLSGQYSLFADTWQKPYANLVVEEIGLELPEGSIEPEILTGLTAFARAGDLDKVRQYTEAMQWPATWSEQAQGMTDFRIYGREVAAAIGMKQPWIKSEETMNKEAQAAQAAEQEQMLAQEASKAAPDMMKQAIEGET